MLNDPLKSLAYIERLLYSVRKSDPSTHPGVFAAMAVVIKEVHAHIEEVEPTGSAYMLEKARDIENHVHAMFSVDHDNGHDWDSHSSWALSNLETLINLFEEQKNS